MQKKKKHATLSKDSRMLYTMMTLQKQVVVITRLVVSEQSRTDGKNHIAKETLFFLFVCFSRNTFQ